MDNRKPYTLEDLRDRVWYLNPCGHYSRTEWNGGVCQQCESNRVDHELHKALMDSSTGDELRDAQRRRCRCSVCSD